jgi:hypothetical protein
MSNEDAELDRLQNAYSAAVDTWINAIRAEGQLALASYVGSSRKQIIAR